MPTDYNGVIWRMWSRLQERRRLLPPPRQLDQPLEPFAAHRPVHAHHLPAAPAGPAPQCTDLTRNPCESTLNISHRPSIVWPPQPSVCRMMEHRATHQTPRSHCSSTSSPAAAMAAWAASSRIGVNDPRTAVTSLASSAGCSTPSPFASYDAHAPASLEVGANVIPPHVALLYRASS